MKNNHRKNQALECLSFAKACLSEKSPNSKRAVEYARAYYELAKVYLEIHKIENNE